MDEALHQISDEFRGCGLLIDNGAESSLAWEKATAIRVLSSLNGTKVAVAEVDVYVIEPWGPTETEESWISFRQPGQTATDYAETSRRWATQFISEHKGGDETLYLLWFDDQRDAA
ncbi:MAG TPA: Imm40 family immunity protein [Blastocatellia bacterium]|nr:Imm40 family immunity protein [Blastocatellia bacterium]